MSESKEQNGVIAAEHEESNGVAAAHTNQGGGEMHHVESKEDMFEDATDDIEENQFQEIVDNATQLEDHGASSPSINVLKAILDKTLQEKQTLSTELKEERESIAREVSILCHELKGLADKQSLSADDGNREEIMAGNDTSLLREMLSECSQFVKVALDERLRTEGVIRELNQRIEDLTVKAQAEEAVADRMLASLGVAVNPGELLDYSVMGKLAHVERSGSLLLEHYSWMLYEIDQLRVCLTEGGFNFEGQEPFGPASVFAAARGELVELKSSPGRPPFQLSPTISPSLPLLSHHSSHGQPPSRSPSPFPLSAISLFISFPSHYSHPLLCFLLRSSHPHSSLFILLPLRLRPVRSPLPSHQTPRSAMQGSHSPIAAPQPRATHLPSEAERHTKKDRPKKDRPEKDRTD